jgi:outer membrane protein assembly factor BamB
MTVVVTTDIKCSDLDGVGIAVGAPGAIEGNAAATYSRFCDDSGYLGALVVSPSGGSHQDVGLRVLVGFGKSAEDCFSDFDEHCVVARRALQFQSSINLQVPIFLEANCAGVPCDATSTCANGRCVPAGTICDATGTCPSPTPTADIDPACGDRQHLDHGPRPMMGVCRTRINRSKVAVPKGDGSVTKIAPPANVAAPLFRYPPAITRDGKVVFMDAVGVVYKLDPSTNKFEHMDAGYKAKGDSPVYVRADDGVVFVAASNNLSVLYFASQAAYTATVQNGEILTDPISGPDGKIYVGSKAGVRWFARKDGDPIGSGGIWPTEAPVAVPLTFTPNGDLIALDQNGNVNIFDTTTGTSKKLSLGASALAPAAVDEDGVLYFAASNGAVLSVYAVSSLSPAVRWKVGAPGVIDGTSSPAIGSDGLVYFASAVSGLVAYDRSTGMSKSPTGTVPMGLAAGSPTLDAKGRSFYATSTGALGRNGLPPLQISMSRFNNSGAIAADGTLVLGDETGALFIVRP